MSLWARLISALLPISLLVGGLGMLLTWSQHSDRFPLKVIEVRESLQHVVPDEVTSLISPYLSKGFFGLDIEAIQERLSQVPWVASTWVRRVWPDRLVVSVKEQTAQARWGDKGVLSTEGFIFYPDVNTIPDKIPQFLGPKERAKEMLQHYFSLLELLGPIGLSIRTLELSSANVWKIMLDNGIAIILGKLGSNERLSRFVSVYQSHLQAQIERIAYIDLRYTNGFAIGWKSKDLSLSGG